MSKIITPTVAPPAEFDFGFMAGMLQFLPLGEGAACNPHKIRFIEMGPATDKDEAAKGTQSFYVYLEGEDDPFELSMDQAFRMQNNLIALLQAAAAMQSRQAGGRIHTV